MPNESHPSPDEVRIEQLEVFTVIGVLENERKGLQRLMVSISFWPYEHAHDLADNIEKAVNYSAVAEETKRFAREQAVNLIETLADRLAAVCLAEPMVREAEITVHKPQAPVEVEVADISVTIRRSRE